MVVVIGGGEPGEADAVGRRVVGVVLILRRQLALQLVKRNKTKQFSICTNPYAPWSVVPRAFRGCFAGNP